MSLGVAFADMIIGHLIPPSFVQRQRLQLRWLSKGVRQGQPRFRFEAWWSRSENCVFTIANAWALDTSIPGIQGAGAGVFFWDVNGVCVAWDVTLWPHILEKSHAEALAARFAVELAGNYQGQRMEFRGGCPRLISLVGNRTCWAGPIEPIVSDIRFLMRSGVSGNTAAWLLAKHASVAAAHRLLPACVEEALHGDKLGLGL
ncbi:hypothetical protein Salat_0875700 [Sesamum alatum]|uniref:Uncharacterized protein n=1 Tax=Sesamum alatum TaxID=300844 RepID=A0AAE2CQT5_9LAMI|nr:hypothetical protein Salat_0875700 [Sesamum alatum]